jgi:hypothetical protein
MNTLISAQNEKDTLKELAQLAKAVSTAQNDTLRGGKSSSESMLNNFELMLGFTKNMLSNMGAMDSGLGTVIKLISQMLGSFSQSGTGGILGSFGGILGSIIGGPFGTILGSVLGGLGGLTVPRGINNSAVNESLTASRERTGAVNSSGGIINQVIIKNPVTFQRAFDVEVRTRAARGGIDL